MRISKSLVKTLIIGILSVSMVPSVIAGGTTNNTTEKRILTLERAISGGIDKEDKIAVFSKQITAYNEKLNVISNLSDTLYYNTKYTRDNVLQQKELLKDIVEYNVTILYNNIVMLQKQMELNEVSIKIGKKKLKQAEIKNKNGQLSELQLSQERANLEELQSKQKQNELTLADYKSQFINLTNINIDQYDELETNLTYEPIEYKGGVNGLITRNVDFYMKNAEDFLAYQKNNLLDIAQSKYGTGSGPSLDTYYGVEAEVAESEYTTQQKKKNMIEGLKGHAVELEKLQTSLAVDTTKLEHEKKNLNAIKIKYAKGYVSELEMENVEQNILSLELAVEQKIYSYNQQKMILEKPWVKY